MCGIYQLLSFIPYGEEDLIWIVIAIDLHPLTGKERKAQSVKRKEMAFISLFSD